ncbi:MAG: SAM-dependent methyltransferase [Kofleriaceae bacterium]
MKLLALVVLAAACGHSKAESPVPTPAQIVANPDRTKHDLELDAGRKPVDMLTFFALTPGMHVADLGAGGGYTTELVARSVGPSGVVFAQDTPNWGAAELDKIWKQRLTRPGMANTHHAMRQWDDPLPPEAKSLDAVTFVCAYHDVVAENSDPKKLNQAVFAALKSGGTYTVIDNSAKDGSGVADCDKLHRIDEKVVRDDVLAAGFKLARQAEFLRNSGDARDWNADPGADPRTHTQDRFVLEFVKP